MGYSITLLYGDVQDVSDKAARKAARDTSGMWKSRLGVFHPMI